jgi:hypothetical protein
VFLFELANTFAVKIQFVVADEEAQRLLAPIHSKKNRPFLRALTDTCELRAQAEAGLQPATLNELNHNHYERDDQQDVDESAQSI